MFRRGIVRQIDGQTARVRVEFPDLDGLLSGWLPVGQDLTLGARSYRLPRVGAQVAALLDEHAEDGVVLCGLYSQADPAPVSDPGVVHLELEDGTTIHAEAGKVQVSTPGTLEAVAGGSATVEASTITLRGATTVDGTLTVTQAVELKTTLKVTQDATIGGKSFLGHVHTSAAPGQPTSAPN